MTTPMHDEWQIRSLLERYCRHLDDRQYARVAECFTEDCVYFTMGRELCGRADLLSFFPEAPAQKPDRPTAQHLLSNVVIDIDGDSAAAESDWTLVERGPDGLSRIVLAGRYRDRLARGADDVWRIQHRRAIALQKAEAAR